MLAYLLPKIDGHYTITTGNGIAVVQILNPGYRQLTSVPDARRKLAYARVSTKRLLQTRGQFFYI